ncbi:MAG: dihydroorotase [Arenicellales bacterium]
MTKILIKGARVVDPANNFDSIADVTIVGSRIVEVGKVPQGFKADRTINADRLLLLPGIIDLCARLREPGEEQKATIASETTAAATAGITGLVCPPDTWPVVDTPAMANMIRDRAEANGQSRVYPLGALTVGLEGEKLTDMAMLLDAGCVGVSNGLKAVSNTLVMRRAMQYASTYDIPVFLTPQDPWLLGNGVVHEGKVSTRLGLPAIPEAAETVGVARDLALIETSGARAHVNLISCGRSVTMLGEAQSHNLPVSASVAIHQLLLCEDDIGAFDTRYKVFPPLRTAADRQALFEGVRTGTVSVICSDHQPHGADAKLAPFSEAAAGIAGVDTLLALTLSLTVNKQLPLSTAVAALTCNPARVIGVDRGHLSVGANADLCLVDPTEEWILNDESMQSRGQNSPFMGKQFFGKTHMTMIEGEVIFQDADRFPG